MNGEDLFPDPRDLPDHECVVAWSHGVRSIWLAEAYEKGIFPWPADDETAIPWVCPNPRAILRLERFHLGRSSLRDLRRQAFRISVDQAFPEVIAACASAPRQEGGTWILPCMQAAYLEAHRAGLAHSLEVWQGEELVGGLYGLFVRGVFSGESMFHRRSSAGKAAIRGLVAHLAERGVTWFDIQQLTPHMHAMGAEELPRSLYLDLLRDAHAALPVATWA